MILFIICNLSCNTESFENDYRSLSKYNEIQDDLSKNELVNESNIDDKNLTNNLYASIQSDTTNKNKLDLNNKSKKDLLESPPLNKKYSFLDENKLFNDIRYNNIDSNKGQFNEDNKYNFNNDQYMIKPEYVEKKFENVIPPENMQKTKLVAKDLLPNKNDNLDWFQVPNDDFNLLEAVELEIPEIKIGVDTVAQSRKNATYDIRAAPPNPKFVVSPWCNSTIEPDYNIKPLC